ncbi:hypothetical protein F4778DRAFT_778120 [Xylariomycetidae sp. FL2044]|nr:hypothetical protein F4778DRAFT_778120 [Xylariomycetidae sp. FL2044]
MFARLRPEKPPTPFRSEATDPPSLRRRNGSRSSLLMTRDEDDSRPHFEKRRAHHSITPRFERSRKPRIDQDDAPFGRSRDRRPLRSPSPSLDPPIVADLHANVAALRTALHSHAMTNLDRAQKELSEEVVTKLKTAMVDVKNLEKQNNHLHRTLWKATLNIPKDGENTMTEAAQAEIDRLGKEWVSLQTARSRPNEDTTSSRRDEDADMSMSGIMSSSSSSNSYKTLIAELEADLAEAGKEALKARKEVEEEFLQRNEDKAVKMVQSLLNK